MSPDLSVIERFEPRLERPGEQRALLRGVVLVGATCTAWAVTPWEEWIRLGDFPDAADAWRRLHEIDGQMAVWRDRGGRALHEHATTPLLWLALEWAAVDLDVFNALWGVPAVF